MNGKYGCGIGSSSRTADQSFCSFFTTLRFYPHCRLQMLWCRIHRFAALACLLFVRVTLRFWVARVWSILISFLRLQCFFLPLWIRLMQCSAVQQSRAVYPLTQTFRQQPTNQERPTVEWFSAHHHNLPPHSSNWMEMFLVGATPTIAVRTAIVE